MSLRKLPLPSIIEEIDYESIVARKLSRVKEILAQRGVEYQESEADDLMTLIEADAYDEMLLRTSLNTRIKQLFLAYATGSNLDHIGTTRFGVKRLEGKKPTATVEFTLSAVQEIDVVIPHGVLLGNGGSVAELMESVIIRAGEFQAGGTIELNAYVRESAVKAEIILTPLPWVVNVQQLTQFNGGADTEEDERYRDRIWMSRERNSTAGSELMYRYYAMSADVRVAQVAVKNGGAGVVEVVVLGEEFVQDSAMLEAVGNTLNQDKIRPVTDIVKVMGADILDVSIEATLYVSVVDVVDIEAIKARFRAFEGQFGVYLSLSKIYELLGDTDIVEVKLSSPDTSVRCTFHQVMRFGFVLSIEERA